jgi:hypothetical protein
MKSKKLNNFLTLAANIGVLIGIIVVIYELQQTQDSMAASGHSARTDRNMTLSMWSTEQGIGELNEKFVAGESLSSAELGKLRSFNRIRIRHFEDLHYQRLLGIIDDETWEANLIGISNVVNDPTFDATIDLDSSGFRKSFKELMLSLKTKHRDNET